MPHLHPVLPILVIGAGPTGLSLAITLRRFGVPVRVVDRAPQPSSVSKALAVWSGSLEALEGMQAIEFFLAEGQRLRALCVGHGRRRLATLAVGDGIDSPYPYPLLLPQSRTEEILTARLAASGVTVERQVEATGLAQDENGVTAILRHADGRHEEVRTPYAVGADGARSFVRQALGIAFEGYTEPQTYLLCDAKIDGGNLDHRSIYLSWRNGGTVALFPFGTDVWRVFTMRDGSASAEAPITLEEMQDHLDRHGPGGLRLGDPGWLSVFRINERLAARYRVGRCFLAGDAAHIHSPAGGQGMNTGIQDAVNLGWKLAHAVTGRGDAEMLLESYGAERRPIARAVVDAAAQKLHVAFGASPMRTLVKDIAVGLFGNLPAVQRKLQVELSETEIVYRDGPLVQLGVPPREPRRTDVGARARDAEFLDPITGKVGALWPFLSASRHSLLLFEDGQPIEIGGVAESAGDGMQVLRLDARSDPGHRVRRRYHLQGPGWVLIRPDQVVAARGAGADLRGLATYVDRVLRPAAATAESQESGMAA